MGGVLRGPLLPRRKRHTPPARTARTNPLRRRRRTFVRCIPQLRPAPLAGPRPRLQRDIRPQRLGERAPHRDLAGNARGKPEVSAPMRGVVDLTVGAGQTSRSAHRCADRAASRTFVRPRTCCTGGSTRGRLADLRRYSPSRRAWRSTDTSTSRVVQSTPPPDSTSNATASGRTNPDSQERSRRHQWEPPRDIAGCECSGSALMRYLSPVAHGAVTLMRNDERAATPAWS